MAKHTGKYKVVCGSQTKSYHRKKKAATKAAPSGCRVSLSGLGSPKGRKHRGYKRKGRRLGR